MFNKTTTDYAGAYIYENSSLKFMNHPEGYMEPDGVGGYEYVYQYKDHLGNIRLSYSDSNNDGLVDSSEIMSEKNYYPFGILHKGYNNITNGGEHPYKYQGQELTESFDYNMYEFELRHYDAALGRFITTDPYEQFHSPYLAMGNNPVTSFDPDGGYCYDINGNQVACPDNDDFYADYIDNPDNHITLLDGVEVSDSDSNENEDEESASNETLLFKEEFLPIWKLTGIEHTIAEIELNIFGRRNVQGRFGKYHVDAEGNILFGPYQGGTGAIGLIGGFYNPKSLLKVATILDKGGLTKIGRALQKHGSRPGSKFPKTTGNPTNINAQGEKILNDILTNPASTTTTRHHARFGEVLEIKAPNGQGARFSKDGKTFIGLIEN